MKNFTYILKEKTWKISSLVNKCIGKGQYLLPIVLKTRKETN